MKPLVPFVVIGNLCAALLRAYGIPEPGIVLYGKVTNAPRALRSGALTVEFTGPNGKVVRVTSQLTVSGYRMRVPFETLVGGNIPSVDAFAADARDVPVRLTAPAVYSISGTNSFAASFVLPDAVIVLPAGRRAMVQQVNFVVSGVVPGASSVRLAEARLPAIQSEDISGSGVPMFQFTRIAATEEPGILVEWTGAPVNRAYYLLRSADIDTPAEDSEVVRYFPASPLTANSCWDTNTVNTATYFYKLLIP